MAKDKTTKYKTNAERQRAYRARKAMQASERVMDNPGLPPTNTLETDKLIKEYIKLYKDSLVPLSVYAFNDWCVEFPAHNLQVNKALNFRELCKYEIEKSCVLKHTQESYFRNNLKPLWGTLSKSKQAFVTAEIEKVRNKWEGSDFPHLSETLKALYDSLPTETKEIRELLTTCRQGYRSPYSYANGEWNARRFKMEGKPESMIIPPDRENRAKYEYNIKESFNEE